MGTGDLASATDRAFFPDRGTAGSEKFAGRKANKLAPRKASLSPRYQGGTDMNDAERAGTQQRSPTIDTGQPSPRNASSPTGDAFLHHLLTSPPQSPLGLAGDARGANLPSPVAEQYLRGLRYTMSDHGRWLEEETVERPTRGGGDGSTARAVIDLGGRRKSKRGNTEAEKEAEPAGMSQREKPRRKSARLSSNRPEESLLDTDKVTPGFEVLQRLALLVQTGKGRRGLAFYKRACVIRSSH